MRISLLRSVKRLTRERALYAADVSGDMKKYACVLVTLNGGQAGVDHFIRQNPLFSEKQKFGNPVDCLE